MTDETRETVRPTAVCPTCGAPLLRTLDGAPVCWHCGLPVSRVDRALRLKAAYESTRIAWIDAVSDLSVEEQAEYARRTG